MYHAHAHGQDAVPNGMFGTIFVGDDAAARPGRRSPGIEIPADLEIAQDFPMVLNDAGVIGLTLDGKSFPATAPIVATEGDWIQVSYYNEGLQVHPMHLHGFEQIVIAKDGEPLDHPYAADTILVAPGERYTVIFNANAPGTWVWHCHILNHVESADGMFGMVTAVVVNEAVMTARREADDLHPALPGVPVARVVPHRRRDHRAGRRRRPAARRRRLSRRGRRPRPDHRTGHRDACPRRLPERPPRAGGAHRAR